MPKKVFVAMAAVLILTSLVTFAAKYYTPNVPSSEPRGEFPVVKAGWEGHRDDVPQIILEALNPDIIFSGSFANAGGRRVRLLFQYYSPRNRLGGPHSPRNCLPGSGWLIEESGERIIELGNRTIRCGRFLIRFEAKRYIMDFWYITRYGETASDYALKLHLMATSLMFRPHDLAFVRVVGDADPEGLAAIEDFERNFVGEIYDYLPF